jgi:cell division protein FtsW (lipid II flippase)
MIMRRRLPKPVFNPFAKSHEGGIDLPLLISVLILVLIGLIMVYDASVIQAYRDFGDK